jgi:hypothetical protein
MEPKNRMTSFCTVIFSAVFVLTVIGVSTSTNTAACFAIAAPPGYEQLGLILTDGIIDGVKTRCILDTGSTVTVVDPTLSRRFTSNNSKLLKARLPSAVKTVKAFENVKVGFKGFPAIQTTVVELDLESIQAIVGTEMRAVIGMDLLASRVLIFGGVEPVFSKSLPESTKGYKRVPLDFHLSCPVLPLTLPVVGNRDFKVDTGNNGCLDIDTKLADILVRSGQAVEAGRLQTSDGSGVRMNRAIVIKEISFLGANFSNVFAMVGEVNQVGIPLLSRFELAFDFPNKCCFIGDATDLDTTPFPVDASGLRIVFRSTASLVVLNVEDESPGAIGGVKNGDEVLRLDGKAPSELTRDLLCEIKAQEGKTIQLSLQRGNEVKEVDILLKRRFQYPPKWRSSIVDDVDFAESLKNQGSARNEAKETGAMHLNSKPHGSTPPN